jgi:hypothetical protein
MKNLKNFTQFTNENINIIKEEIVWFKHFNKASDNFMDLLDAVLAANKEGFSDAVNEFVLQYSKGDRPSTDIFTSVINDSVYEEYYKIGEERGIVAYNFEEFKKELKRKNSDIIFPKMLYNGVMSDMMESDAGSNLLPYTSGEAKKYLENLSVERGKEKLGVMLKNKGIIKEEE